MRFSIRNNYVWYPINSEYLVEKNLTNIDYSRSDLCSCKFTLFDNLSTYVALALNTSSVLGSPQKGRTVQILVFSMVASVVGKL